jgi:Zn-dependent M32 family carboxypeptidase
MAANKNLPQIWKPGTAPYAEFLKSLTPEQKAEHLRKRRERKAMRQVMKETIDEYQAQWASELHNAAWAVLKKARAEGDAQAFASVFDRIVGRPQEAKPDDGRALPWNDD